MMLDRTRQYLAKKIVEPIKNDWLEYYQELLNEKLATADWNIDVNDVQEYWNLFENLLISIFVKMLQGWMEDWLKIQYC